MSDQFKPYVHLQKSGDVYQGNVAMKLRYRIAVDSNYEYYKTMFNSTQPASPSTVLGGARHFEIKGYLSGNVPGTVDPANKITPSNGEIIDEEQFMMSSLATEHKVTITVNATDQGSGTGQSTSYYVEADDDD
ncbi:MAG: hypothetical protein WBB45_01130 [Cyclobacteriaceae bacterium]